MFLHKASALYRLAAEAGGALLITHSELLLHVMQVIIPETDIENPYLILLLIRDITGFRIVKRIKQNGNPLHMIRRC